MMKSRLLTIGLGAMAFSFGLSVVYAGAIRSTGKEVGKTSEAVARTTASAAGVAAGGVATAGKATGGALKDGAPAVRRGVVAAPGTTVRGTAHAGRAIWKAVW
jgi:hypothetical protein